VWWFKPVILALRRRRQEDLKIEDILSYIARLSQKTNTKKKKKKIENDEENSKYS
jgi:hypothetical protein